MSSRVHGRVQHSVAGPSQPEVSTSVSEDFFFFPSAFATLKHLNSKCLCLESNFYKRGGEKRQIKKKKVVSDRMGEEGG